ncbi:unnamed protein product, partial [Ectocarpus sp. 12 AP-2014]
GGGGGVVAGAEVRGAGGVLLGLLLLSLLLLLLAVLRSRGGRRRLLLLRREVGHVAHGRRRQFHLRRRRGCVSTAVEPVHADAAALETDPVPTTTTPAFAATSAAPSSAAADRRLHAVPQLAVLPLQAGYRFLGGLEVQLLSVAGPLGVHAVALPADLLELLRRALGPSLLGQLEQPLRVSRVPYPRLLLLLLPPLLLVALVRTAGPAGTTAARGAVRAVRLRRRPSARRRSRAASPRRALAPVSGVVTLHVAAQHAGARPGSPTGNGRRQRRVVIPGGLAASVAAAAAAARLRVFGPSAHVEEDARRAAVGDGLSEAFLLRLELGRAVHEELQLGLLALPRLARVQLVSLPAALKAFLGGEPAALAGAVELVLGGARVVAAGVVGVAAGIGSGGGGGGCGGSGRRLFELVVAALVVVAGASRRFGAPRRLLVV